VRVRKVAGAGAMRVVARGVSEQLAPFAADFHHHLEGWARGEELALSCEDDTTVSGLDLNPLTESELMEARSSGGGGVGGGGGGGSRGFVR
jgi:hypothetical protein